MLVVWSVGAVTPGRGYQRAACGPPAPLSAAGNSVAREPGSWYFQGGEGDGVPATRNSRYVLTSHPVMADSAGRGQQPGSGPPVQGDEFFPVNQSILTTTHPDHPGGSHEPSP
jgi:hypothetical protein